jgi:serine/threonine protein kinase/Tol biopolymer transport system component
MTMERGSLVNKRYRIVETLGQGGMAAVYRAIDENLGVEVALKENLFTTEEYARQFRLEATILASLRQPNLPRVSDHFVIEQLGQYLVMDYIEGEDLRQRMDRLDQLPEQEVIVVGVAICDALMYMHTRKPMVLHRDIKPGNVRITPAGHIFLVDFGLAKIVQGRETTSTGARAMTPGYSPPEQYGTARTDHRSDVYSLGATLYSALTNQLPEDALARAMGQVKLTPITKHNPRVSQNLAQVIEKCLEVRPDDRYQSAEAVKLELLNARSTTRRKTPIELVLTPPPISLNSKLPGDDDEDYPGDDINSMQEAGNLPAPRVQMGGSQDAPSGEKKAAGISALRNRPLSWVFWGALLLLLAAGLAAYLQDPQLPGRMLAVLRPGTTATQAINGTATMEMLQRTATETSRRLPLTTTEPSPTVSQTPVPTLTPIPTPSPTPSPSPTPRGGGLGYIAFASNRSGSVEIYLADVNGNEETQITNIPEGACQPRWSPDGMRLVFVSPCTRDLETYPGSSLFIVNVDGSNIVPITNTPGGDFDPSWSPQGDKIVFSSLREDGVMSIYLLDLDDNSVTRFGDPEGRYSSYPDWSPDGSAIVFVGPDNRIYAMSLDGSQNIPLVVGGGNFYNYDPFWSPDGSVVYFSRIRTDDTTGASALWAVPYSAEGAMAVEVSNSTQVIDPSLSSDGFWLAFKSWVSGSHDIYLMRSNGVNREPLIIDPAYDFDPAWRP